MPLSFSELALLSFFFLHTRIDFFFLKGDNSEYQEIHSLILHPYDASLILSHILPLLPDTLVDPQFSNSLLCSHHYICMKWFISKTQGLYFFLSFRWVSPSPYRIPHIECLTTEQKDLRFQTKPTWWPHLLFLCWALVSSLGLHMTSLW